MGIESSAEAGQAGNGSYLTMGTDKSHTHSIQVETITPSRQ